jgi:hypothetical protein
MRCSSVRKLSIMDEMNPVERVRAWRADRLNSWTDAAAPAATLVQTSLGNRGALADAQNDHAI